MNNCTVGPDQTIKGGREGGREGGSTSTEPLSLPDRNLLLGFKANKGVSAAADVPSEF